MDAGELKLFDWQILATLFVSNLCAFQDKGAAALVKEDTEAEVHLLAPSEAGNVTEALGEVLLEANVGA